MRVKKHKRVLSAAAVSFKSIEGANHFISMASNNTGSSSTSSKIEQVHLGFSTESEFTQFNNDILSSIIKRPIIGIVEQSNVHPNNVISKFNGIVRVLSKPERVHGHSCIRSPRGKILPCVLNIGKATLTNKTSRQNQNERFKLIRKSQNYSIIAIKQSTTSSIYTNEKRSEMSTGFLFPSDLASSSTAVQHTSFIFKGLRFITTNLKQDHEYKVVILGVPSKRLCNNLLSTTPDFTNKNKLALANLLWKTLYVNNGVDLNIEFPINILKGSYGEFALKIGIKFDYILIKIGNEHHFQLVSFLSKIAC